MSDIDQFRIDWETWMHRAMTIEGKSQAWRDEMERDVREEWNDPELREAWKRVVAEEAAWTRELQRKAASLTAVIKQRIKAEATK